jgi:hypothetical protein
VLVALQGLFDTQEPGIPDGVFDKGRQSRTDFCTENGAKIPKVHLGEKTARHFSFATGIPGWSLPCCVQGVRFARSMVNSLTISAASSGKIGRFIAFLKAANCDHDAVESETFRECGTSVQT